MFGLPTCEYCRKSWFAKNQRGGLECVSCGASAPQGAMEYVVEDRIAPVIVITSPVHLSENNYHYIKHQVEAAFPGRRILILEDGLNIQFVGGAYASR